MKFILLILFALIVIINGNIIRRKCECKAVSHNLHFPYHDWDMSSCWWCSCSDPAIANCEQACKTIVEVYAKSGCGKGIQGKKITYSWDAGKCSEGYGRDEFVCA